MKHLAHLGFHLLFFCRGFAPLAERLALREEVEGGNLWKLLRCRELQRLMPSQSPGLVDGLACTGVARWI